MTRPTSVLIVGDEPELRATLEQDLARSGFEVHTSASIAQAEAKLRERSIDVLLTDLRIHSDRDGIKLLERAQEISMDTRTIVMSVAASAQDYQAVTQLGAVRMLWKPFSSEDLLAAIQEAIESRTGFRGSVHGLSLIDLLQMMHFARRNVTIAVRGPTSGRIHLQQGEIIAADTAASSGEEALRNLLASPSGAIHTSVLMPRPRVINREFEQLLLDVLRQIDEKADSAPESSFDRAFPISSRRPNLALAAASAAAAAAVAAAAADHAQAPSTVRRTSIPAAPPLTSRSPQISVTSANPVVILDPEAAPPGERSGPIDEACLSVMSKVLDAAACVVVDLSTGELLGACVVEGLPASHAEVLADACVDLFRGPGVCQSERMLRARDAIPEGDEYYFHEIHVVSGHNYHFAKTMKKGKVVVMLVTKKTTNVGMGWAMLRSVIPLIEPLVP